MKGLDPEAALDSLQAYLRPEGSSARVVNDWQPPVSGSYEELKAWIKESVLSARLFEAYPDGHWTIELLLKEPVPGTTYRIRL